MFFWFKALFARLECLAVLSQFVHLNCEAFCKKGFSNGSDVGSCLEDVCAILHQNIIRYMGVSKNNGTPNHPF